jgi:hypothetical protein
MPRVEFEPMIPVFERANTDHVLDRAATVIGRYELERRYCDAYKYCKATTQYTRSREYRTIAVFSVGRATNRC